MEEIYGTTSNENIDAKVVWMAIPIAATNKSKVVAELFLKRNNTGFTTYGTGTFSITITNPYSSTPAGKTKSVTKTVIITEDAWVDLDIDLNYEVDHNDSGAGYTVISATGSIPGTTLTSINLSQRVDLPTIARATAFNSLTCDTSYFTGTMTYKYTPKSAAFYNRCNIALNLDGELTAVKTINIGKKSILQQTSTVSLSSDELSTIYKKLPSATSGKLRFTFRTYSDSAYSTQVGDAGYKEITLSIPNTTDTQPTMTMSLSPITDYASLSTLYIKGKSKVKASFTNGAGKYGAEIKSYKMTVSGKDYASPYTSDYLTVGGTVTVKGTITDSRGFSRTYSQDISVIDYNNPTLDQLTCSSIYFNGTMTCKYTPANSLFYIRCNVALKIDSTYTQVTSINIGQKSASQQTLEVTLVESELSTIYNKLPNSTAGTIRFTFRTYTDSAYTQEITEVTTAYKDISLNIPNIDATQPTATLTTAPETSLASPFNTLYIKGKTKVKATLASGAGKYGASIQTYTVTIGTLSGTSPLTSDYFTTAGDVTITGTVTDSRGFSRTYTKVITVIDHSAPRIIPISSESEVIAARCNSEGALDSNGTYLLIAAKRSYSKVIASGVQKNFCALQYRYKVEGGSYSSWTEILSRTATSDEVITGALLGGTLSSTSTYMVQVRAIDDIGEATTTSIFVSTEKVYMHRAGSRNSLGIGKYAEEDNVVDVAEDITAIFRGEVQFKSEAWVELPLGTSVAESTVNSGRWGGTGVFYRVCAGGKHIYVAFNISFTTSSSTVRAESSTIPYPPNYDVYALCPVGFSDGSRGIATVSVSPRGRVNIYAVHKLPGATLSTGETVKWIDGYIDYWT